MCVFRVTYPHSREGHTNTNTELLCTYRDTLCGPEVYVNISCIRHVNKSVTPNSCN
jgi:hypothetical protein